MFLCNTCNGELTDMFTGMFERELTDYLTGRTVLGPGYLELLADAARNRTRLGTGGRRRYSQSRLVAYADPRPADCGGTEGQRLFEQDLEAGRMALPRQLVDGRLNPKASDLLTRARGTVAFWCGEMNGQGLAAHPQAKKCFLELEALIKDIERVINRPVEPTPCGPCPTRVAPDKECGWALEARPEDIEVTCRQCRMTYNVERLRTTHLASIGHRRYNRRDLLDILARIGEPVPRQTMSDWIRQGRLKCCGYQRPTAQGRLPRIMPTWHSDKDKPVYRLEEARALRRVPVMAPSRT